MKKHLGFDRIEMRINNGRIMQLAQHDTDDTITLTTLLEDSGLVDSEQTIAPGDMVMLLNYYQYIKDNDIRCEFINPNGEMPY